MVNEIPSANEQLALRYSTQKNPNGEFVIEEFSSKKLIRNFLIKMNFAQLSQELPRANITLVEFVETMLSKINTAPELRLYVVSGLITFYNCICFEFSLKTGITFDAFTNYVLFNYKSNYPLSYKLKTHKNLKQQMLQHNLNSDLERLNFHSPVIIEESRTKYINLDVMSLKTNAKTFKTPVKICLYENEDRIFVIVLESISSIYIFDEQCNYVKGIVPNIVLRFKEVNIFSVAYSSSRKKVC
jgi:hypothetical protein